jgi:O-antigen ligase/Tfp pilus assembly protein PilF
MNSSDSSKDVFSTVQRRCDNVSVFGFYAMIFFLPIAPAIVESCFGFVLLPFLIKRSFLFVKNLKEEAARVPNKLVSKIWSIFSRSYKPVTNPLNQPLAAYVLICVLSIVLGKYPFLGIKGFVFKLLEGVFIYFVFIESMNTKRRLRIFLAIFSMSMALISFDGIFQYLARIDFIHFHPVLDGRVTASFKHANDFGGYLVSILPIILSLSIIYRFQRVTYENVLGASVSQWGFLSTVYFRYCMAGLFLMALASLGFTFSRGAWLGFAVSLLVLGMRRPKILLFVFVMLISFMAVFIPKMMTERTTNTVMGFFNSSSRDVYWNSALNLIVKSPFIGHGLNAYTPAAVANNLSWQGYPHNCYLQIAAETGLFGLVAFLWIFIRLFRVVFQRSGQIQDFFSRDAILGVSAALAGFLVHSFFDTAMYSVQLSSLMWILMGIIIAIDRVESKSSNQSSTESPAVKKISAGLMKAWGITVVVLALIAINYTQRITPNPKYGEVFYQLGMQCGENCEVNKKLGYFEKAIYYDPQYIDAYYQLGMVHSKLGNQIKNFDYQIKAYNLSGGKHYAASYEIGRYYYQHGDLENAFRHFLPILKIIHTYKLTHYYIGRIHEHKGEFISCDWYYERTVLYQPQFVPGYLRYGILFVQQGDWKKAKEVVQKLETMGRHDEAEKLRMLTRGIQVNFDVYDDFNCANVIGSVCRADWGEEEVVE